MDAVRHDAALMQYRHEQIELRDNSKHYKEAYGVDVAMEIQTALKALKLKGLTASYNTNLHGYLMLAKTDSGTSLSLTNKFDYLSNGRSLTGYHFLRSRHLEKYQEVRHINYLQAIE